MDFKDALSAAKLPSEIVVDFDSGREDRFSQWGCLSWLATFVLLCFCFDRSNGYSRGLQMQLLPAAPVLALAALLFGWLRRRIDDWLLFDFPKQEVWLVQGRQAQKRLQLLFRFDQVICVTTHRESETSSRLVLITNQGQRLDLKDTTQQHESTVRLGRSLAEALGAPFKHDPKNSFLHHSGSKVRHSSSAWGTGAWIFSVFWVFGPALAVYLSRWLK
jgi:hypothetical protein